MSRKSVAVRAARRVWLEKLKNAHHFLGPFKLLPRELITPPGASERTDLFEEYAAEFERLRKLALRALRGR